MTAAARGAGHGKLEMAAVSSKPAGRAALTLCFTLLASIAAANDLQMHQPGHVDARLLHSAHQRQAAFRHGTLTTTRSVARTTSQAQPRASSAWLPANGVKPPQAVEHHVWVLGFNQDDQESVYSQLCTLGGDVLRVLPGSAAAGDDYHWMVAATEPAISQLLADNQDITVAWLSQELRVSEVVKAIADSAPGERPVTLLVSMPQASPEHLAATAQLARQELPAQLGSDCELAVAALESTFSLTMTLCHKGVKAAAEWAASQARATWVTVEPQVKLHNLYASAAIQDPQKLTQGVLASKGAAPPAALKGVSSGYMLLWKAGLTGKGQVVAVFDTGIDTDSCFFFDPKVPDLTKGSKVTRVPVIYSSKRSTATVYTNTKHRKVVQLTRVSDAVDAIGHGTHVACTIAGNAYGFNPMTQPTLATGVAPDAKLAVVDVSKHKNDLTMDGWTFDNVPQIYEIVRKAGARITSTSLGWNNFDGLGQPVYYSSVDEYCYQWDAYTWRRTDMLHVCSAGNEGALEGREYVEAPGICKNTLTVGATDGWWFLQDDTKSFDLLGSGNKIRLPPKWDYWRTPGYYGVSNYMPFENIASYSAFKSSLKLKGDSDPDPYPRIKPDTAAPGLLLSAWSDGKNSGKMDKCTVRMNYGTSMSTPVVSGAAAIVRQYFLDGYYPSGTPRARDKVDPSGTLVKAVLIAGTAAMKGQSLYDEEPLKPPPSPFQGFGRVDLTTSLPLASDASWKMWARDDKMTAIKQSHRYQVRIGKNASKRPLVVVLTWYDWPAAENTGGLLLVNDLDLVVQDSKGNTYPVNGKKGRDSANTVEKVYMQVAPAGQTLTITVRTAKSLFIKALPQSYSLVVLGPLA